MLLCKSYFLDGGILFTCASVSKDLCCFMISWRLLGKRELRDFLSLESCWWMWWMQRWSREGDCARSKVGWSSGGKVRQGECVTIWSMHPLKHHWATCSWETEPLPWVKCKLIQLSDFFFFNPWSFISSPHSCVSIWLNMDNVMIFYFFFFP